MAWECSECGSLSTSPPCDECGSETGEYTGFVWVCPECGRESTRYNPPCPRCGGMDLEKRRPDYEDLDEELAVPSYRDLARPLLPVVAAVVLLVALFATGVLPLPEDLAVALDGPGVTDAPGSADRADGLNLSAVESGIADRADAYRAERGADGLERDETLAEMATFANQRRVVQSYDGGSVRGDLSDFSPPCSRPRFVVGSTDGGVAAIGNYGTEAELADALFDALVSHAGPAIETASTGQGVDVHVGPDGRVYVVYVVC
ncbi:hypothetical protein [Haloarchaeobius sp. HRN-SO-5]|uniref:hypothetical protein n=1 Tax=Haloarchaeobius sp. HRN-SO-5 TaxID=3446118 RepID=UPI003EC0DEEC